MERLRSLGDLLGLLPTGLAARVERRAGSLQHLCRLDTFLEGFDIAHAAELANPYSLQAIRARERGACQRMIATVWENIPLRPAPNPVVARRIATVAHEADHFLAVTERARLHLCAAGVDSSRISVIPMGVDVTRFKPRAEWGRTRQPLRIITVARLVPEKGVEDLIEAVAILHARGQKTFVTVVGGGPREASLRQLVGTLKLSSRVNFVGAVAHEHMPQLYADHSVFVLASGPTRRWREQLGFALVEAMATGLAVLAGYSGSIPEVVASDRSLVPPHDPLVLAERLQEFIDDPQAAEREGERNRARALARFDARQVGRRIDQLYREVLAR